MDRNPARITREMLRARMSEQLLAPQTAVEDAAHSNVELLSIPRNDVFITEAYRRILGREPDLDGMHHFLRVLNLNPRQVVIDALEAAVRAAPATGEAAVPTVVELSTLEEIETPDDFVRRMYSRVLCREADTAGLAHYRSLLAAGVSRKDVVSILTSSEEARNRQAQFRWDGSELAPAKIHLSHRIRLFIWKWLGLARLEEDLSGCRADLRATRARQDAIGDENRAGLAKLLSAQQEIERKCESLTSTNLTAASACRESLESAAARAESLSAATGIRMSELSAQVKALQSDLEVRNRAHADAVNQLSELRGSLGRNLDGLMGKLEAVAAAASAKTDDAALAALQRAITESFAGMAYNLETVTAEIHVALGPATDARFNGVLEKLDAIARDISARQDAGRTDTAQTLSQLGPAIEARLDGVLQKLDAIGGDIGARQEAGRTEAATILAAFGSGIDARLTGIVDKLEAVARDIQARQEAFKRAQDEYRADVTQALATLRDRADIIAKTIRPPVITAPDFLVTKADDFLLVIPRQDWALAAYYTYWGSVDLGLTRHLNHLLRPGMVVVDIGTNIGIHTLQASRAVGAGGRVYSFEPTPTTFAALQTNLHLNRATNVKAFPYAVLDRSMELPLYLTSGDSALNSLYPGSEPQEKVLVRSVTLDEALEESGRVDLVKIDAEGAEPLILKGMGRVLADNPAVIVLMEFSPAHLKRAGVAPEDFLNELKRMGFDFRDVNELTGELAPATAEELLVRESSNLQLTLRAASQR